MASPSPERKPEQLKEKSGENNAMLEEQNNVNGCMLQALDALGRSFHKPETFPDLAVEPKQALSARADRVPVLAYVLNDKCCFKVLHAS